MAIIFLIVILLHCTTVYSATCFPSENLWHMTKDICDIVKPCCSTIEKISSELDACCSTVENISSTIDICCSVIDEIQECLVGTPITQAGVPYVLSEPGNYYLCESISGSIAITIASNDVHLDLNGHTITSTGTAITMSGRQNIVVTNGSIQANNFGVIIDNNAKNVFLSDLIILDCADDGIGISESTNITIHNCCFVDQPTSSASIHMTDTLDIQISSAQSINILGIGILVEGNAENIEMEHCSFKSGGGTSTSGIALFTSSFLNVSIKNCIIENFSVGIHCPLGGAIIVADSCIVLRAIDWGFMCNEVESSLFKNCSFIDGGAGFLITDCTDIVCIDCVAQRAVMAGFLVDTPGNILLKNCTANNNPIGFSILGAFGNTITLDRCVASYNNQGINTAATTAFIVDCRSQHAANPFSGNPAYNLNNVNDSLGVNTVVIVTS